MNLSRSSIQNRFDVVDRRRRPQRPHLRLLPRQIRPLGGRFRAPRHPRRRRRHRGIPPRLPQLHRQLHGEPAEPQGDPRPAAGRARPEGARAAHAELPAAARRPRAHRRPRASATRVAAVRRFSPRDARTAARLLQDARRRRGNAARASCWKHRPPIRAACATCGARCSSAATSASSRPKCSATSTSCSRAAPATC